MLNLTIAETKHLIKQSESRIIQLNGLLRITNVESAGNVIDVKIRKLGKFITLARTTISQHEAEHRLDIPCEETIKDGILDK